MRNIIPTLPSARPVYNKILALQGGQLACSRLVKIVFIPGLSNSLGAPGQILVVCSPLGAEAGEVCIGCSGLGAVQGLAAAGGRCSRNMGSSSSGRSSLLIAVFNRAKGANFWCPLVTW